MAAARGRTERHKTWPRVGGNETAREQCSSETSLIEVQPLRKDSVLVFDNGQPLRKLSELLFEKKLLIPALRQLVSSHPNRHDG
jgi:hypothetical protein